jgi:RNA polymerase sigma-70 factor (ECF subfamily)
MVTSVPHPHGTLDDGELARLATGGDGHAFAELYDRHEQRVYGFCMRMLSTPHDAADATQETFVRMLARLPALQGRDLQFVAYTLATARNVCYDMIRSRRTVEPVAEEPQPRIPRAGHVEEDPERFAMLTAAREEVRAANAALPARQREVLALREVELLSYDEIGELMNLNRNAVAQLVSRARIKLSELLRGSALASVSASSPDCTRALPLLGALEDGEDCEHPDDLVWARGHLAGCESCRLSLAAMQEAGASYRAIGLLVPAVWLRKATIARAAELVGADWSHVGEHRPDAGGSSGSGSHGDAAPGAPAGIGLSAWRWAKRPGARHRLIASALLALCALLVAMAGSTRDGHLSRRSTVVGEDAAHAIVPAANSTRKSRHRSASAPGADHAAPSLEQPAHANTSSTLPTPHHAADRGSTGGHRHHRARRRHQPAPAKPAPAPPPAGTPTATTPTTSTPVASPPPVSTPTTTTPTQTTPEPAPPTTTPSVPTNPGGGLIP